MKRKGIVNLLVSILVFSLLSGCGSSIREQSNDLGNKDENEVSVSDDTTSNQSEPGIFNQETESDNLPFSYDDLNTENNITTEQSNPDMYYYDMLHYRTLFSDSGSMYYNTRNGLCYFNINPNSIDGGPIFLTKEFLTQSSFCVVLNDYVYYSTGDDYADTRIIRNTNDGCHIKRYNLNTTTSYDVVGGEGYGLYCLSNNEEIYGMICTYEEYPVMESNGAVSVATDCLCNLIKIDEMTGEYDIVNTFDARYEYILVGVYDDKAYFSKQEPTKYSSPGIVRENGNEYGLVEYDIKSKVERSICSSYKNDAGSGNRFYMAQYNNRLTFFYERWKSGTSELHAVDLNGNDTIVFASKNQFGIDCGGVNIFDDIIYISVYSDSGFGRILYKVENGASEILGIPEAGTEIVFIDPYTKALSYIDSDSGKIYVLK